ncbi:MAG: endolytic transglycosylase MltG [Bacteroidales bacterium]|nr:endolytic transglycosylase MltG [Bacteroidales bacterium]
MRLSKKIKIIAFALLTVLVCVAGSAYYFSRGLIYRENIVADAARPFLYIPTGSSFEEVCALLVQNGLQDEASFRWVAGKMNYPNKVKAGRYKLLDKMCNIELVRMLRSGKQIPVKVTFNNIRTGAQLAGIAAASLEADSADIARLFTDSVFLSKYHLTPPTALSIFIPNTYEMLWNSSAEDFWERMDKEYKRFWNVERTKQSENIGLTPIQVSILASIIEEETNIVEDKPVIAGVYMNRLHKGMELGACPTIKFVLGDFTITRILTKYTKISSPYNTYMNTGLPPGVICVPSIASIDAVLNYTRHDYLFFCAKADFSGRHHFSRTLTQHNKYAAEFHKELNKRKILK